MRVVIFLAALALIMASVDLASASTASQREYKRGYADCQAGRYDQDRHGASYKKGCRAAEDKAKRTSRPEDPSVAKWVAGRFLREGSYAGAAAQPSGPTPAASIRGDALVPGTRFHATGDVPCARRAGQPMGACKFGVVRRGGGNGDVTVFWPDGGSRTITFEKGAPLRYDESQADAGARLDVTRNADLIMLRIGDERFEIPDVVIFGG